MMDRETAASEANQSALLRRSLPTIETVLALAETFRTRIAPYHCSDDSGAVADFVTDLDAAIDRLTRVKEDI
jgi:hypothetical protein